MSFSFSRFAFTAAFVLTVLASRLHPTEAFLLPRVELSTTAGLGHSMWSSSTAETTSSCSHTALGMGTNRKARRTQKADRSRPNKFYDAIEDASKENKQPAESPSNEDSREDDTATLGRATTTTLEHAAATSEPSPSSDPDDRAAEARRRMDQRPEVSTMIVDDETGIEVVAQGQAVMDVITRKPVRLSTMGPAYRLAQMFPGVPPPIRQQYRFDWTTVQVPEMVEQLREACSVTLPDGSRGIPPHPSVANKALDFVLANRDYLGYKMKRTLGRLTMRSMSQGDKGQAREYQKLWKNFLTLENHISAPFRQMLMDAEGRVGPNFGNLDVQSFCKGELYERCANYLILKGMVAHWEKKVVDADLVERTPQTKENYLSIMAVGDPKRYLPDPPILFTLKECTQVCYMAQQMTKAFVTTPELFDDLPPEIRFLEQALSIKGATPLRKFVVEEFCPAEGITPEALREGMRRLLAQLENMQIDPYGDITNVLQRLCIAMAVGSDDDRDPYAPYLVNKDPNGPGAFQSYTFDHEKLSLVRFLDSQYERYGSRTTSSSGRGGLFNLGGGGGGKSSQAQTSSKSSSPPKYKVPEARALGRPHELGWLDLLKDEQDESMKFGKMAPGRIIPDDEYLVG